MFMFAVWIDYIFTFKKSFNVMNKMNIRLNIFSSRFYIINIIIFL